MRAISHKWGKRESVLVEFGTPPHRVTYRTSRRTCLKCGVVQVTTYGQRVRMPKYAGDSSESERISYEDQNGVSWTTRLPCQK